MKQNCRRSAETKPRPSTVLFYFSFIPVLFSLIQFQRCANALEIKPTNGSIV